MAPKGGGRGGGGGGGVFGGSSGLSDQCQSAGAFTNPVSIVAISFMAIFLVTYLGLTCFLPNRQKRAFINRHRKARAQWCALWFSLICGIAAMILLIANTVMNECLTSMEAATIANTSLAWTTTVSVYTLLGVIIVSICRQMHAVAGQVLSKLVSIAHIIYMVVLGIFMLAFLGFQTNFYHRRFWSEAEVLRMQATNAGLAVTYDVLALLGALLATANIGFAIMRSSKLKSSGPVKKWAGILVFSSIILTLVQLGYKIHFNVLKNRFTPAAWIIYIILNGIFYATTFIAAIYLVSEQGMVSPNDSPLAEANFNGSKGNYSEVPVPGQQHPLLHQPTEYQGHGNPPPQGQFEPMRSEYNNQGPVPPAPYDASSDPLLQQSQQPYTGQPSHYHP